MKFGDLLLAVGASPLTTYKWAPQALEIVNNVLPTARTLTTSNTGNDITTAIDSLSVEDRVKLLSMEVDMVAGTLTPPSIVAPAVVVPKRDPRQVMALVIGAVMVFTAVLIAVSTTITQQHNPGQQVNNQGATQLLSLLLDLVKALLSSPNNN